MEVNYGYQNWNILIGNDVMVITCQLEGKDYQREYDAVDILKVCCRGEYTHLVYSEGGANIQVKFEGDSGLIIDDFDEDGEFINTVGCHDFWDDVDIEDESPSDDDLKDYEILL
jgi:hypothetical protein